MKGYDIIKKLKDKQITISVNNIIYEKYIDVEQLNDSSAKNLRDIIVNFDKTKVVLFKERELKNTYKNNKEFIVRLNKLDYDIFLKLCIDNNLDKNQLINNFMLEKINKYDKGFVSNILNSYKNNFVYPLEIVNYKLNETIKSEIKNMLLNNSKLIRPRNCYDIEELYMNLYKMRYIFNYSPGEINDCFLKLDRRSVQLWLKSVGWQFDNFEAQQKTVLRGRRDYKQIAATRKATQLKNSIIGSNDEEYIRQQLNIKLTSLLNNTEVIIGVNNISILENGKEVDIPIIILQDDKIYKFAVECNGDFWHQDTKRDKDKKELITKKGYELFYVIVTGNTRTQREIYGEIDDQINDICNRIKESVI